MVDPIPEDFRTITPHLTVRGAADAVAFYRDAFGAQELYRNIAPDGESIIHAELLLGDSRFFVNEEFPEHGAVAPDPDGYTGATMHLYVADVDAFVGRALGAGAREILPVADQFWGDRYGILADPFGHRWSVASRIEDLSPAEVQRRAAELFGNEP